MKAKIALVSVAVCIPVIALGQQKPHQGPDHLKIEFENDSVLVLRIQLAPHEKTPMHQVTPGLSFG
jgi:hypothetical protein